MWDTLIISPFTNVLLFIYSLVGNFGIAIILFTILIRLITHPLMARQLSSSKKMSEMQSNPKWLEIQEKYKGDKEKLAQEQMAYYKEIGFNPLASCLPTIIQLPLIIALYQTIQVTITNSPGTLLTLTRHIWPSINNVANLIPLQSHFLWFDLGQPERLNIPGLGFGIPVLAVIVCITTYMQSKLITPPTQPTGGQGGGAFANSMNIYMTLLMGYLALTFSSALSLYFLTANLFGIAESAALGRIDWRRVVPSFLLPKVAPVTTAAVKTSIKPKSVSQPKKSTKSVKKGS